MEDAEDDDADISTAIVHDQININSDIYITYHLTTMTDNSVSSLTTSAVLRLVLKRPVIFRLPLKRRLYNISDYLDVIQSCMDEQHVCLKAVHMLSTMLNNG